MPQVSLWVALWLVNALWRSAEPAVSALLWRLVMKLHSCPHPLCQAANGVSVPTLWLNHSMWQCSHPVPAHHLLMTFIWCNRWENGLFCCSNVDHPCGGYMQMFSSREQSVCRPACNVLVCSDFVTQTWYVRGIFGTWKHMVPPNVSLLV